MAKSVVTTYAKFEAAQKRARGTDYPKIIGIAIGDGGVDNDGNVIQPLSSQQELNHEITRVITNPIMTSKGYCYDIVGEGELHGKYISEMALYDEDDKLLFIVNFSPKFLGLNTVFSIYDDWS